MRSPSYAPLAALCVALAALGTPLAAQDASPRAEVPELRADSSFRSRTSRELRTRFVRDQTILGFTVYGPSFAAMVADDGVTAGAAYLVMAGGSFFASAELSRRMDITEARHLLSTAMAWRTAGAALALSGTGDAGARSVGAVTLLGGFAGTGAGLMLGKGLTGGEAAATVYGHDMAALSALAAITLIHGSLLTSDEGLSDEGTIAAATVAGWFGYGVGRAYARRAPHNVTVGDVQALWIGTTIGALGAATTIASADPDDRTVAGALLGGSLLGAWASERFLVRRYDHTRAEGNLLALGGTAGALMGIGLGILIAGEADRGESLTFGFATAGAIGGVAMTERYLQPARDRGRLAFLERVELRPLGAVAAATGRPGAHTLLRFTF